MSLETLRCHYAGQAEGGSIMGDAGSDHNAGAAYILVRNGHSGVRQQKIHCCRYMVRQCLTADLPPKKAGWLGRYDKESAGVRNSRTPALDFCIFCVLYPADQERACSACSISAVSHRGFRRWRYFNPQTQCSRLDAGQSACNCGISSPSLSKNSRIFQQL